MRSSGSGEGGGGTGKKTQHYNPRIFVHDGPRHQDKRLKPIRVSKHAKAKRPKATLFVALPDNERDEK